MLRVVAPRSSPIDHFLRDMLFEQARSMAVATGFPVTVALDDGTVIGGSVPPLNALAQMWLRSVGVPRA